MIEIVFFENVGPTSYGFESFRGVIITYASKVGQRLLDPTTTKAG
jgi:hypothetical protein